MRVKLAVVVVTYVLVACGAPAATVGGPVTGTGAPCGLTPEESAAPVASNANYVPPAPSTSASAPAASASP